MKEEYCRDLYYNYCAAVNCSTPPAVDGLVIELYNDTTEGAVVYYHCDSNAAGLEPRLAVCTNDGYWSPQLQSEKTICMHVIQLLILV